MKTMTPEECFAAAKAQGSKLSSVGGQDFFPGFVYFDPRQKRYAIVPEFTSTDVGGNLIAPTIWCENVTCLWPDFGIKSHKSAGKYGFLFALIHPKLLSIREAPEIWRDVPPSDLNSIMARFDADKDNTFTFFSKKSRQWLPLMDCNIAVGSVWPTLGKPRLEIWGPNDAPSKLGEPKTPANTLH